MYSSEKPQWNDPAAGGDSWESPKPYNKREDFQPRPRGDAEHPINKRQAYQPRNDFNNRNNKTERPPNRNNQSKEDSWGDDVFKTSDKPSRAPRDNSSSFKPKHQREDSWGSDSGKSRAPRDGNFKPRHARDEWGDSQKPRFSKEDSWDDSGKPRYQKDNKTTMRQPRNDNWGE